MMNFKEEVTRPRKIALYTSMTMKDFYMIREIHYRNYDEHYSPLPEGEPLREESYEGYVRISEPMTIEFQSIDNDTLVQRAVESLDAEERKVLQELNSKIADIRSRKSQLLALTYEPV